MPEKVERSFSQEFEILITLAVQIANVRNVMVITMEISVQKKENSLVIDVVQLITSSEIAEFQRKNVEKKKR